MNVAGTRALLDPPAGLVEGERPELPVAAGGCGLTPPELEVVAGFGLVVVVLAVLVVVFAVLVVAAVFAVLVVAADGLLAELDVILDSGVLAGLFVLVALDVVALVDACFEPPHATSSAAVASDAQIWIGRFTRSA